MASAAPTLLMTTDAVGGIWTYAIDLARGLDARGVAATLAVVGPAPSAGQREAAAAAGIRVVTLGHNPEWLAGTAEEVEQGGRALGALAARIGAGLLHLNHPALAAGLAFDGPLLVAGHSCMATWWAAVRGGPAPASFAWQTALVAAGYRAADAVIVPTAAFAAATQHAYGIARPPTVVFNGRAAAPAAAIAAAPEAAFALTAGRLWDEGKDVTTLERTAPLTRMPIRAAGPLAGPNGTRVVLSAVEALGPLDEPALRALLAKRPVFVSTARYEPFGLSILEAAQAGCALVLSDIPTLRDLWEGVARFVPVGDAAGFAAALDHLAADPAARHAAGAAARGRAARYTLDAQCEAMLALYAGLADRRSVTRGSHAA